jgi:hypothetical protein
VKQKEANSPETRHETPSSLSAIAPGEIILGALTGIDTQGQPLVDYSANPIGQPLVAVSTLGITKQHIGRQVALLFANGDPASPVIMGLIHSPLHALIESYEVALPKDEVQPKTPAAREEDVTIDGKRIVIEGQEEIVLKCGDASITLTKAGKILIRGKYLLNRASGVNRIMGGSVQVN